MLEIWNNLVLVIWLSAPLVLIVKWTNWKGFILALLSFYLIGVVDGYVSGDINLNSVNNNLWLIFGIPVSIIYGGVIFFLVFIFKKLHKSKKH